MSSFLLIPYANAIVVPDHYYAGYRYTGGSSIGVRAKIFTEWLEMPIGHEAAEWDSVILKYYPSKCWLQTGYIQKYKWLIIFPVVWWRFYLEKMDENGHWYFELYVPFSPITGHTYTYTIWYSSVQGYWKYDIKDGSAPLYNGPFPNVAYTYAIDLQAFVEMPTTKVHIDGSHFSEMKYLDASGWTLWDDHYGYTKPKETYSLTETSDYEFYAFGGG